MEARITTRLAPYKEDHHPLDESSYHTGVSDISQKITAVSQQKIKSFEIDFAGRHNKSGETIVTKAQRDFPGLDLTPLESTNSLKSVSILCLDMMKNPRLFESIKRMHLTVINLPHCYLNDQFLSDFSDFLSGNNLLKGVHLAHNEFTPAGCKPLITVLMKNRRVKELTMMGHCAADDAALNSWCDLLRMNRTLTDVSLGISVVKDATWPQNLAEVLKINNTIKRIWLQQSYHKPSLKLDSSQIDTLCQGAPEKFWISRELMTKEGYKRYKVFQEIVAAKKLMDAHITIKRAPSEEKPYPRHQFTSHTSSRDISQKITEVSRQPIDYFSIEYPKGDNKVDVDLTPLESVASLKSVSIARVDMMKNPHLFETIKKIQLTAVSFHICFLNDQFLSDFSDYLSNNNCLQEVFLGENEYTPAGCKPLIDALKKNRSVKNLTMVGPPVADDAALNGWCDLFRMNRTLERVSLCIRIAKDAAWPQDLAEVLQMNHTLKKLSLQRPYREPSLKLNSSQMKTLFSHSAAQKLEIDGHLITANL